ncbi:hypothetical protein ADK57_33410 [Streptomyces sp. MMG1533]|nr:hypothetical protein ADK57_33410 [Streptomyces sp. MMG1533]
MLDAEGGGDQAQRICCYKRLVRFTTQDTLSAVFLRKCLDAAKGGLHPSARFLQPEGGSLPHGRGSP